MKKLVTGLMGVVALATAATGIAAPEQTFLNCVAGIYVNAGLGYSDVFATASHYSATSDSQGAFGWDALLGYQFNPYFALESSYISFGHAMLYYAGKRSIKQSLGGFNVDIKGLYPISGKMNLIGTAGVIRMTQTFSANNYASDDHAWTPDLGAGFSYDITRKIALTLQDIFAFQNSSANIPSANVVLVGTSYRIDI